MWHSSRDAWPRRDPLKKTYGKGWKRSRFDGDLMIFVDFSRCFEDFEDLDADAFFLGGS
jgi:hypothetical protein